MTYFASWLGNGGIGGGSKIPIERLVICIAHKRLKDAASHEVRFETRRRRKMRLRPGVQSLRGSAWALLEARLPSWI